MNDVSADAATAFQQRLGYTFRNLDLLERALTHKSFSNENRELRSPNNERLEFLGDAVLGFVIGELIYRSFPNLQEGALSKIKAHLVSANMLSTKARALEIGRFLRMGAGEARSGGAEKLSLLADAFEAVVAAVYLDAGFAQARELVLRCLQDRIAEAAAGPGGRDYKTRLQELTASRTLGRPRYLVRDEGPDHAKHFFATVLVGDQPYGEGEGRSKKQAEQVAARMACEQLRAAAVDGNPVAAHG
jgi:ribonuclease-3